MLLRVSQVEVGSVRQGSGFRVCYKVSIQESLPLMW